LSDDKSVHRIEHVWTGEGTPTDQTSVGLVIQEAFPWLGKEMHSRHDIVVCNLGDLPQDAEPELQYCRQIGIQSFLMCPMYSRDEVVGIIGIDMIRQSRNWNEEDIVRLRLIGEMIANAIMRKQNEQEIRLLKERLEAENSYLVEEYKLKHKHEEIIGNSHVIQNVLKHLEQVAPTEANVLILGETGTGKELLAYAIHRLSSRNDRPLVSINCAALTSTLIESELFGREKGAYTGALSKQVGRFEIADGSSIFLDEIGELPLEVQAKLLRVLQSGEFERLGSPKKIKVNVRIIAATNRDLAKAVREGTFREDLFYRLNVFPITMPPLRDRSDDLPLLVWAFVKDFEKSIGRRIEKIPTHSMEAIKRYTWPGNVRELHNVVERAMILESGPVLRIDVPKRVDSAVVEYMTLDDVEKKHILEVLEQTGGRVRGEEGAAERLGLKPTTLESRMKRLGIQRKA